MTIKPKNTIYSIIGTTSSGKTSYAFDLGQKVLDEKTAEEVWIISADSRQVFKGLEILTGSDVPEGFMRVTGGLASRFGELDYFVGKEVKSGFERDFLVSPSASSGSTQDDKNEVKLFGISCIHPNQEWSVGHFRQLVHLLLEQKTERTLVLIVGGTGLYHDSIFKNDAELSIPPDEELREKMEDKSVDELQDWLEEINSERLAKMNNSDKNNPRRLMRAIEIGVADAGSHATVEKRLIASLPNNFAKLIKNFDHKYIGLTAHLESIEKKIEKRVVERLEGGAIEEVEKIIHQCNNAEMRLIASQQQNHIPDQIQSIIGFQEILDLIKAKITKEECIAIWKTRELQYAKRQITWWKKHKDVVWITA